MRLLVPTGPPLVPSPDDARSRLRRELLDPDYHQQNLLDRFVTWLERRLDGLLDATSSAPGVSTLLAMVVLVALVLALGLLLSRLRRHARAEGGGDRAVLSGEALSARELRSRAEAALAAGRFEEATIEGFRALTVRQIERGRLPDTPGTTAHEVSLALVAEHPEHAVGLHAAATLFDRVLYGERRTDRDGAVRVLELDDALGTRRGAVRR